MTVRGHGLDLRLYFTREPLILAVLSTLAVALFLVVTGLSHVYHTQQKSLGNRWFARGVAELNSRHFGSAEADFRTALLYSRDNYTYQLKLAEALIGSKRTEEAYNYLINLWERTPEDGVVNLELARIAAPKGETEQALRYYHNAIYALFPSDQEVKRGDARVELIEFQLSLNENTQAQSELIALAANLGNDPSQQARVGGLFLRAQDYEHALDEYRLSLKTDRHNSAAQAGAGIAAFHLGRYAVASRYLQAALAANPTNEQVAARLKTADLILQFDPFQPQFSESERNRVVVAAFAAAGQRLKSCLAKDSSAASGGFTGKWEQMKRQITEHGLQKDPGLIERAMELVFEIERDGNKGCEPPSQTDKALLLIAKIREGN
jgi:tetratricopeptide (TPR) repeat protein